MFDCSTLILVYLQIEAKVVFVEGKHFRGLFFSTLKMLHSIDFRQHN